MIDCRKCEHCIKNGGSYFESYHCDLGAYDYKRINIEVDVCPLESQNNLEEEHVEDDYPKKKHVFFHKVLELMKLNEDIE